MQTGTSGVPLGQLISTSARARRGAALVVGLIGVVLTGLVVASLGSTTGRRSVSASTHTAAKQRAARALGHLPLRFEANRGQTDARVNFIARGAGYTLFLTPREAVLSLVRGGGGSKRAVGSVLRMRLLGGAPNPRVAALDSLPGTTSYVKGSDRSRWHSRVPGYGQVRYRGVYRGVDLLYHGRQGHLEYDFRVARGADPAKIALGFRGATRLALDREGNLVARTRAGSVREPRPVLYQHIGGQRRAVSGGYVVHRGHRVGFRVGRYDHSKPLVIDPELAYSSYLGGATGPNGDEGRGVAVDSAGDMYVAGQTSSPDFPKTTGAYHANPNNPYVSDAFVTKLNPAGDGLIYSTFVGGGGDDPAYGLALDASGRAYITGFTTSTDFPTTPGAFQSANQGGYYDAFLSVLKSDGSGLDYSSYLGGGAQDQGRGVALDSSGNAYVTGFSGSTNLPTKAPSPATPFQGTRPGGQSPFVAKINPNLDPATPGAGANSLVYSTFLGGTGYDFAQGIAVDSSGSAYVTGNTSSGDFPTQNPTQASLKGSSDAFAAKLNPQGSALAYSTYLGGTSGDSGSGIAVDSAGDAFLTGSTQSTDFPTEHPFQGSHAGDPATDNTSDAFVTKLAPAGSSLTYSSYLGGRSQDSGAGIALDGSGAAYVVGEADASNGRSIPPGTFPTVDPVAERAADTDTFLSKVRPDGTALAYSTYLGGGTADVGNALAVDSPGNAYVTGNTYSTNFPTRNAFQAQAPSSGIVDFSDAFVAKVAATSPAAPLVTGLGRRSGPAGTTVQIAGHGFTGASAVRFGGTAASSFTVDSDKQITAIAPGGGAGPVAVTVTSSQGTSPPNPIATFTYAEGTWDRTAAPATAREDYETATLLADGKVLVAGGQGIADNQLKTFSAADVYDPASESWKATESMKSAREEHTATLLPNGKVLVAGGYDDTGNSVASTELYDPATGSWSESSTCGAPSASCPAPMITGRAQASATSLADGRVLVVGGVDPNYGTVGSAEIFNSASGKWVSAGSMQQARSDHTATLIGGSPCNANPRPGYCGKVLVVGGGAQDRTSAELYDPASKSWSAAGSLVVGVYGGQTATSLPDGRVLIAGGFNGGTTLGSAQLYDPASGTFSLTENMQTKRKYAAATLLGNGKVLVAGGVEGYSAHNTAELYDPGSAKWVSAGVMYEYGFGLAVTLHSGKVLLLTNRRPPPSPELYTPPASPAPGGGSSPSGSGLASSGTTGAPDKAAPVVSGFGLTNNPFTVGGRTPIFGVAARARRHRRGTTFRYTLSEAATVRIVIAQGRGGRRRGRRCVAPTRRLRHARKCVRLSVRGTLTRTSRKGANRVAFSGRIGSKKLSPGRYQATLTATDAAKNTSKPKTIAFTIVRR